MAGIYTIGPISIEQYKQRTAGQGLQEGGALVKCFHRVLMYEQENKNTKWYDNYTAWFRNAPFSFFAYENSPSIQISRALLPALLSCVHKRFLIAHYAVLSVFTLSNPREH